MAQTASCRVTGPGVFEIAYGRPQPATLELAAGWNLVGVPTQGSCTAGSLLSAEAGRGRLAGPVWCWDGQSYAGLTATDVISAERGYWIFGFSPAALDLGAAIPADGFIDLREGWSLISPASAALVPELPGADAAFWGWDADFGQYVRLGVGNRLVPGLGYWVWVGPPGPWPLATGDGGSASPFP
jgi:hypothetical protein